MVARNVGHYEMRLYKWIHYYQKRMLQSSSAGRPPYSQLALHHQKVRLHIFTSMSMNGSGTGGLINATRVNAPLPRVGDHDFRDDRWLGQTGFCRNCHNYGALASLCNRCGDSGFSYEPIVVEPASSLGGTNRVAHLEAPLGAVVDDGPGRDGTNRAARIEPPPPAVRDVEDDAVNFDEDWYVDGNYMNHNLTYELKVAAIRDFNRRQGLPIENPNKVLFNEAIFEESQLDFKPRQGYIYEPIAADSDIE